MDWIVQYDPPDDPKVTCLQKILLLSLSDPVCQGRMVLLNDSVENCNTQAAEFSAVVSGREPNYKVHMVGVRVVLSTLSTSKKVCISV